MTKSARRDLELPPLEEDVAAAALAAQPDVGAEAVHEPLAGAAWMGAAKADDVAQVQLEHRPGGHRRERIRGVVAA